MLQFIAYSEVFPGVPPD